MSVIDEIAAERRRQIEVETWTPNHDDQHDKGEMANAAACYAMTPDRRDWFMGMLDRLWPWDRVWWKPGNRRRELVKAAALIVAEIERFDRKTAQKTEQD